MDNMIIFSYMKFKHKIYIIFLYFIKIHKCDTYDKNEIYGTIKIYPKAKAKMHKNSKWVKFNYSSLAAVS